MGRGRLLPSIVAALCSFAAPPAIAQEWPMKPVRPHVASGKLRAIAVTSAKPDPKLPGAEPITSQGARGFEAYTWWGVYARGRMNPALAALIHGELGKAPKTPAVAEKLSAQGIDVWGAPPAELDAFVRSEIARWDKVIRANGIKFGD